MKILIAFFLLIVPLIAAESRTWTNSEGKKIKAELVSATDDSVTLKMKRNNKTYVLKLADLSEPDQQFIKDWTEENAERLKKEKEAIFTFGDTKLVPEKPHILTIKVDKAIYESAKADTYTMGIAIPKNFDPKNKKYTLVHISVAGKGKASGSIGSYLELMTKADCVLIATDDGAYGNIIPKLDVYSKIEEKWAAKEKKWPFAFYGFSGGAKASGYKMANAAAMGYNVIGAYMTGCNEDTTARAMDQAKLKSSQKKLFKNGSFWLSSGTTDDIATPAQHDRVMESMKSNRMKHVKIHTFVGGHTITKEDQVMALNWMLKNAQDR